MMSETTTTWITLSEGKSFSRLLYPNPVCFLGTLNHTHNNNDGSRTQNVMVLSWLTATNNNGRFVFSICRRRFTAVLLKDKFTLSVPKRGMEDLVLNVGSVSGKRVNKFQWSQLDSTALPRPESSRIDSCSSLLSRRKQRKFLEKDGVPGLQSEPFGGEGLFAVRGTIAQMACEIIDTLHTDEEHIIFLARVLSARVDGNYWEPEKQQFQPLTTSTAPYLTFFGSQTFGYVHSNRN